MRPDLSVAARNGATPAVERHHDVLLGYLVQNEITQSFHRSLLDLIGCDLSGPGRLCEWAAVRTGPLSLPESRNKLCAQLLEGSAEWLFMLDADMGFEPDTLHRLLACADPEKRPVVGALAFAMRELRPDGMGGMDTFPSPTILMWQRHDDGVWRFTGRDHYPVNSLIRIGATGAACLLIHRGVLERIREHYGETWFDRTRDGSGQMMGEDVSFCGKLAALEVPVWMHTGIRTTHFKHVWLGEGDFWQSRVAPPATEIVDVIVPVLHRPQNVAPLLRSLRASTGLATAWFVCEPDDQEEIDAVRAEGGNVLIHPGTFAAKVNFAFAYRPPDGLHAPWLLLVGDDVSFRPAWLDQALDVANRYKADVIGTNDLLNPRVLRGEHATHPLIRRSYVEQLGASWDGPGVVCHEGYHHWFVDDEIVIAAQLRGTFQAALGSHVEHVHPLGGAAELDDVYRLGESRKEEDARLFQNRLRDAMSAHGTRNGVGRPSRPAVLPERHTDVPSGADELIEV